ncbi:protease pro-enzyme activation domain-containing protein [Streptacidiphilus monticola]
MKVTLRSALGMLAAPLPILALAVAPAHAAVAPQAVHGDLLPQVAHATQTGTVADSTAIPVTLSLKVRDQAGLDAFVKAVADPKSPQYKHYLTVAQFRQRFGASAATVGKVTGYLRSQGLKVGKVSANGLTVEATGTAKQVQRAFGTKLATFRQGAHRFFANTAEPVLPAGVAAAVADIAGLNNYATYHHNSVGKAQPQAVSHAVTGLTPTKARSAYNVTSAISSGYNGSGVTVGLLEFSAFKQSNITTYDNYFSSRRPPRRCAARAAAPPTCPARTRSSWTSRSSRRSPQGGRQGLRGPEQRRRRGRRLRGPGQRRRAGGLHQLGHLRGR